MAAETPTNTPESNRHWPRRLLTAGVVLLTVGVLGVIAQANYGIGLTKTFDLSGNPKVTEDQGYAYRLKIEPEYRTPVTQQRGVITRDGEVIGKRVRHNSLVREKGQGRYKILDSYVRFSTVGNAPLDEGKYGLRVPYRPKPFVLPLLLGLLAIAFSFRQRIADVSKNAPPLFPDPWPTWLRRFMLRPSYVAILVFFIAFGVRSYVLLVDTELDTGGLVVEGKPYSDSIGWNEMAVGIANGRGITGTFDSHRGFYGIFLAGWKAVAGDTVIAAKWLNVLVGSITVALIYLLAALAISPLAGVAAAAFATFSAGHLLSIHPLTTEGVGLMFTVLSIYLIWAGWRDQNWLPILIGGLFFGLANLTRTLTIFAAPAFAFLLVAPLLLPSNRKHARMVFRNVGILTLGVSLVIVPWIIRQKVVHDLWTISSNSADLLYATVEPGGGGRWGNQSQEYLEAANAGIADNNTARSHFFSHRYVEEVKADPKGYVALVGENSLSFVDMLARPDPLLRLCIAGFAGLACIWLSIRRRSMIGVALLPAVLGLLVGLDRLPPLWQLVTVVILSFGLGRWRWAALLVATLGAGIIMSALVGNFGHLRTVPFLLWIVLLLALASTRVVLNWLEVLANSLVGKLPARLAESKTASLVVGKPYRLAERRSPWNLFTQSVAFTLTGACVACVAFYVLKTATTDRVALDSNGILTLTDPERDRLLDWTVAKFPETIALKSSAASYFYAEPVEIGYYRCRLDSNQDPDHWVRMFEPRPYPRLVETVREGIYRDRPYGLKPAQFRLRDDAAVMAASDAASVLPSGNYVMVGIRSRSAKKGSDFWVDDAMIEAVGLLPYDLKTGLIDFDGALPIVPTPEGIALLKATVDPSP